MAETIEEKGARLYEAGAVTVIDEWDDPPAWKLEVAGDTHRHMLMVDRTSMACDCPASGMCSHQVAARLWLERGEPVHEGEVVTEDVEDSAGEAPLSQGMGESPPAPPSPADTSLAVLEPPPAELGAMILSPIAEYRNRAWGALTEITNSGMVPRHYAGKPGAALAAVLLGRDWGLGPVESLQYIDNINGSVEPNAELKLRMYRRAGHRIVDTTFAADSVKITGRRGDNGEEMTVEFSLADAKRMGLVDKDNWKKDPESMLWARAVSRLVRRLAPDCMDR